MLQIAGVKPWLGPWYAAVCCIKALLRSASAIVWLNILYRLGGVLMEAYCRLLQLVACEPRELILRMRRVHAVWIVFNLLLYVPCCVEASGSWPVEPVAVVVVSVPWSVVVGAAIDAALCWDWCWRNFWSMTELTARSMDDRVGVAAVPVVVARLPASCVVVGLVVVAGRASEAREVPAFEVAISMCRFAKQRETQR